MQTHDDILELLREKGAEVARKAQRGLIIQPGAIGDCILTLPLAAFMKETLGLGGIDVLGHTEYLGILPGRTCIDGVSSINSIDLHRLFVEKKAFDLVDRDPLISTFTGYAWIATFLGEPNSNFEQNLIFTANCSHSSEVMTLYLKPPKDFGGHLADFYIEQFVKQTGLPLETKRVGLDDCLIRATRADVNKGRELLKEAGLAADERPVVIQPGSGGAKKCWHLDNFLTVAGELQSKGVEVIFLLGPAELDRYSSVTIKKIKSISRCLTDLCLMDVLGLLSCSDTYIGNDSGITHLAGGLGVRTFAIFGPTNSSVYRPIGPDVRAFENSPRTFTKKPSVRSQRKLLGVLLEQC